MEHNHGRRSARSTPRSQNRRRRTLCARGTVTQRLTGGQPPASQPPGDRLTEIVVDPVMSVHAIVMFVVSFV